MKRITTISAFFISIFLAQPAASSDAQLRELNASFTVDAKPISPLVIRGFESWISDTESSVVSIDVRVANNSNQFGCSDCSINDKGWITWQGDKESYSYKWLGRLPNGLHIVYTRNWSGGSGVWVYVTVLRASLAKRFYEGKPHTRPILTTVDTRGLGDGFKGDVRIVGAKVRIVGRSRNGAESMVIDSSAYQK